jgi:hypothetical protein
LNLPATTLCGQRLLPKFFAGCMQGSMVVVWVTERLMARRKANAAEEEPDRTILIFRLAPAHPLNHPEGPGCQRQPVSADGYAPAGGMQRVTPPFASPPAHAAPPPANPRWTGSHSPLSRAPCRLTRPAHLVAPASRCRRKHRDAGAWLNPSPCARARDPAE